MDKKTAEQIDVAAILNTYVYMDEQQDKYKNKSLSWILDNMPDQVKKTADYKAVLNAVNENPKLGKMKLVSQSMCDTSDKNGHLIIACAFEAPNGDIYVSYRGTGDGKWVDNGVGIANESSIMQREANKYFNQLVEEFNLTSDTSGKLIVTGHSKGGNEAQYITLNSKYGYLIDKCYSIDGQGFSREAIDHFIEKHGEDYYNAQLQKMYSINGDNDYVHGLGIRVIPENHTYYIETDSNAGFGGYHDIKEMLNGAGLNWKYEDSKIVSAEQGMIGELAYVISERLQIMNQEDLEDCAVTVMSFLEFFMSYQNEDGEEILGGKYKIGTGDKAFMTSEELAGFFAHGLPAVFGVLLTTEEGRKVAIDLVKSLFSDTYHEHGVFGVFGLSFVISAILPIAVYTVECLIFVGKIYDLVTDFIDSIKELAQNVKKWFSELRDSVNNTINKIISKVKSWTVGGKYAVANPQIKVDTYKLNSYAQRIRSVQSRITRLDSRLDSLYWRVGLLDLWNLMQADILTGYSWRLNRCASYLSETARDFDSVENELQNSF